MYFSPFYHFKELCKAGWIFNVATCTLWSPYRSPVTVSSPPVQFLDSHTPDLSHNNLLKSWKELAKCPIDGHIFGVREREREWERERKVRDRFELTWVTTVLHVLVQDPTGKFVPVQTDIVTAADPQLKHSAEPSLESPNSTKYNSAGSYILFPYILRCMVFFVIGIYFARF